MSNRAQRRAAAKHGKRKGETYADVLAQKRMIKEAVERNVHDRSIAIESDIKSQRLEWMSVIALNRCSWKHWEMSHLKWRKWRRSMVQSTQMPR